MFRDDILYTSATALAHAIRARVVSSAEVVEAYLQRIEAVKPQLNAIVQLNAEAARWQAREADAAFARGELTGPLYGVPLIVKDVFDTAGLISAVGLEERTAFVPTHDATVVARLRAAVGDPSRVNLQSLHAAYYTDDGISSCSKETIAAVLTTAQALAAQGLAVEEARPSRIAGQSRLPRATGGIWRFCPTT
jgi:hypothetical protein